MPNTINAINTTTIRASLERIREDLVAHRAQDLLLALRDPAAPVAVELTSVLDADEWDILQAARESLQRGPCRVHPVLTGWADVVVERTGALRHAVNAAEMDAPTRTAHLMMLDEDVQAWRG